MSPNNRKHVYCHCTVIEPSCYDRTRCARCGGYLHPVALQILKEVREQQPYRRPAGCAVAVLAALLVLLGQIL